MGEGLEFVGEGLPQQALRVSVCVCFGVCFASVNACVSVSEWVSVE